MPINDPVTGKWLPGTGPGPGRTPGVSDAQLEKRIPGFRYLKNLTRKELVDVGNVLIKGDMTGLKRIHDDPASPALLALFASVILKSYSRGDMTAFDMILTRLIGRPPQELNHGGAIGGTHGSTVIVTLPSNGKEARIIDVQSTPVPAVQAVSGEEFDFG